MYFSKDSSRTTFCMWLILSCQYLTSCCVPEYVSFGLSFSSPSHRSPFNSLASKAECLYKVSKQEPTYLLGMLLVKQCVSSGLAGLLLPPHLFSDLWQGQFPAQLLFIYFVRNATPVPAGTAVISWLLNLFLLLWRHLVLQLWHKCKQKHDCAWTIDVTVKNMAVGCSWGWVPSCCMWRGMHKPSFKKLLQWEYFL